MPHRFYFFLIGILLTMPSCGHDEDTREIRRREFSEFEAAEQNDAVDKAMPFLPMLLQFENGPILRDFNNQVNSWAILQKTSPTWKRTSLWDAMPPSLLATDFGKRIDKIEFADLESEYLSQCKLMKDVGRWIVERPYRDRLFSPWLKQQSVKLKSEDAIQLEKSMKIFDWTMRNVALEGDAKDIEALIQDPRLPLTDLGAGYRATAWQTMVFGRGDALQRTRVFTQLLFQQNISAVILALPDLTKNEGVDDQLLWCVGVPIAEEIYLFETRFGLPLPLADLAEVATLREAKTNPSVLRRAKLPGRFDYPVSAEQLTSVIALLDVEPFALGQGMKVLEERLTGEFRMKLSIDADGIAEKLKAIEPDLQVKLWQLPWLAQIYHRNLRSRIHDLSQFSIQYMSEFGAYLNESVIQEARMAHLNGLFQSTIDVVGAPKKYMDIRIDDGTLAKLEYDADIQRMLQVVRRSNENQEEFLYRIRLSQQFYRAAKLDSNAFLGILQFELDNLDSSIDWLNRRLLQINGPERWRAHAKYILGRAYEEREQISESLAWYKNEGVPQEAGNRIRARLLEKMHAAKLQSK